MTDLDDFIPPARLRVGQIITGALVLGLLVFLAVAVFIVQVKGDGQGLAQPPGPPILTLMALGMLAVLVVASVVVPRLMVRQNLLAMIRRAGQSPPSTGTLLGLWQSALIVGLALIEGPAFFGVVAYLLEARVTVLVGVGVALLLMLSRFPTEGRVRAWLRRQQEFVERERERIDAAG